MNTNYMAGYLEGFSDARVADVVEIKQSWTVALWRAGKRFPQRRLWVRLAVLKQRPLMETVKEIYRAYEEWRKRNGDAGLGGGEGDGQAPVDGDGNPGAPDGSVVLAGQSAGETARGVGDDGPRVVGSRTRTPARGRAAGRGGG